MVAINEIKERLKMAKINVDRDAPMNVNEQRGLLLKVTYHATVSESGV